MNATTRLSMLATAIIASSANAALADNPPPNQVSVVSLYAPELVAFALYEGVLHAAEGVIQAKKGNCDQVAGSYGVTVYADGSPGNPSSNVVNVTSPNGLFELQATLQPTDPTSGLLLKLNEPADDKLAGVRVKSYLGRFAYIPGDINNTLVGFSSMNVFGAKNRFDSYQGKLNMGFSNTNAAGLIFGKGHKSVFQLDVTLSTYSQNSTTQHADNGSTFFEAYLFGDKHCHIVINSSGYNTPDFFSQNGYLTIEQTSPK